MNEYTIIVSWTDGDDVDSACFTVALYGENLDAPIDIRCIEDQAPKEVDISDANEIAIDQAVEELCLIEGLTDEERKAMEIEFDV